jgi:hypothetical protein
MHNKFILQTHLSQTTKFSLLFTEHLSTYKDAKLERYERNIVNLIPMMYSLNYSIITSVSPCMSCFYGLELLYSNIILIVTRFQTVFSIITLQ